jgi:hypothetical protein
MKTSAREPTTDLLQHGNPISPHADWMDIVVAFVLVGVAILVEPVLVLLGL